MEKTIINVQGVIEILRNGIEMEKATLESTEILHGMDATIPIRRRIIHAKLLAALLTGDLDPKTVILNQK